MAIGDVEATLTLQDIADLAKVRRPVVTMWRKRPRVRGELQPFPQPVAVSEGQELFARDEVVAWIATTGRGNNSEIHLDAPAASEPVGIDIEDAVTLLCLHALTGVELGETTLADRVDLARDADPDDRFLLGEVADLDAPAEVLVWVDDLVEASYGVGEALARLERGRASRRRARRGLTPDAVELVARVTRTCRDHLGPEGVPLRYEGGDPDVALAVAEGFDELRVAGETAADRGLRRRAVLNGRLTTNDPVAGRAEVRVLSVVGKDETSALNRVDELVLELEPGQLGVVVGAASLLCDALRGEANGARSDTLRSRRLAFALRLPRGWWRAAHRQALGLWVLVGDTEVTNPVVADLGVLSPDRLDLDDLTADLLAALERTGKRAYRYGRLHALPQVLANRPVVPRGIRALHHGGGDSGDLVERIHEATLLTSLPTPSFDVAVTATQPSVLLRSRSLGEMRDGGLATVKRGSRIDPNDASELGSVEVLAADRSWDGVRLDPIDALQRYPRATRTEPGDVVFLEKPHPTAIVDERGGSLVASPSRILRLDTRAGIGPHALAAIISLQDEDVREWQAWSVPILGTASVAGLDAALARAAAYRRELEHRLDAASRLTTALVDGVAAGAVALATDHESRQQEGA